MNKPIDRTAADRSAGAQFRLVTGVRRRSGPDRRRGTVNRPVDGAAARAMNGLATEALQTTPQLRPLNWWPAPTTGAGPSTGGAP